MKVYMIEIGGELMPEVYSTEAKALAVMNAVGNSHVADVVEFIVDADEVN